MNRCSTRLGLLIVSVAIVSCQPKALAPAAIDDIRNRAHAAYQAKQWEECSTLYGKLILPDSDPFSDRYNAACCLALMGQTDRALSYLERNVETGERGFQHLERDKDLVTLRGDPRWSRLVARARQNHERHQALVNPQLKQLYEQDQAERRVGMGQIDWKELAKTDADRRAHARYILDHGGARVADDYHHAAMIFQHGATVDDFRTSHELALKAVELEPAHQAARWLAAASKDRELVALGKPQRYGTQFRRDAQGRSERYPVDPSVTNAERARWMVPPIAESK